MKEAKRAALARSAWLEARRPLAPEIYDISFPAGSNKIPRRPRKLDRIEGAGVKISPDREFPPGRTGVALRDRCTAVRNFVVSPTVRRAMPRAAERTR
jgi:hypothetical protein